MARSRKISTDMSTDVKLNRCSEFAALLYTWGIAHAKDNCRLPKRDPEELRLMMFPGRSGRTAADMAAALAELCDELLIGVDEDGNYFYPAEVFYKYQNYINVKNRAATPPLGKRISPEIARDSQNLPEIAGDMQRSPEICGDRQALPEIATSLSPSLSPSPSRAPLAPRSSRARESMDVGDDLGLGDNHPGNIVGWELWNKWEATQLGNGKRLGVYNLEVIGRNLHRWRDGGSDPVLVVETALAKGWKSLHDLDDDDKKPPGGEDMKAVLARIEALAEGGIDGS